MRTITITLALASLALGSLSCASTSTSAAGGQRENLTAARLALAGYDPVSYFAEDSEPLEGDEAITADHAGAIYRFANAANRATFLATPGRFVPAYGGWCAWAMVDGERVEVDPESFLIQDDELLLFYDGFLADTRKKWLRADPQELKQRANAAWSRFAAAPDAHE